MTSGSRGDASLAIDGAPRATPAAELQLLGHFAVEVGARPVNLPFLIQRLVAFLALHDLSRRSLVAGTLWPDTTESNALANLRTIVWRIKAAVPILLRNEGPLLGLGRAVAIDTREQEAFSLRLMLSDVDDLNWVRVSSEHLRKGPLLPGWYDDWVIFQRERMDQLRLHALENAARILTRHGDLDLALDLALEAVCAEPLRETAHGVLMEVFIAEGNLADAVHQYKVFSGLLRRELGTDPSPRLLGLLPPQVRP